MLNFMSSRRKRWIFYKVLIFGLGLFCIVLWVRGNAPQHKYTGQKGFDHDIKESYLSDVHRQDLDETGVERINDLDAHVNSENSFKEVLPVKNVPGESQVLAKPRSMVGERTLFRERAVLKQFDREIDNGLKKLVPGLGEGGEAANVSPAEQPYADEVHKKEAFNMVLSEKISPNRTIPDARSKLCLSKTYDHDLPTASVIIIFTNEAFSTLMRTIHSVVNRTPARLLKQIILIDDFSDREELGGKLERYLERFFNQRFAADAPLVTLHRLSARSGLIRARLAGARAATGDVLVFLDSHCECGLQWMEPLLQRIKEDRTAVLTPIIDVIDDKTLQYYNSNGEFFQVGGFSWSGHFTWIDVPQWEQDRRGSVASPTRTPTMAGGLFAVERNYFWESGSYDEGMDVWGGENLEMSFRIWMCGGQIETIPCSRVGHIFRDFHPYSFPGNKDTHGINTARLAEVWMDDYKRLFYLNRPDLQQQDIGAVEERKEFRRRKRCHSFKWYLQNVIPQKFIPDENVQGYGRVRNNQSAPALCLDMMQRSEDAPYNLGLYVCHSYMAASQMFSLSDVGQLRREEMCATVRQREAPRAHVVMQKCSARKSARDQTWTQDPRGRLVHEATGLCLDRADLHADDDVIATRCSSALSQIWYFDQRPGVSGPAAADSGPAANWL